MGAGVHKYTSAPPSEGQFRITKGNTMSDFPIENKAVPQGAKEPLSSDSLKSTHGFDSANQNSLSFCRAPEVGASSSTSSRGYTVAGIEGVAIKPVDRRTIEGSTPGDFRAKAAPAVIPANPGPREGMGQFPNGKNCKSAPAPQSFPASPDSDAGN
jgi:hypothetical protein